MLKFKVLKYNQIVMYCLGIFPHSPISSTRYNWLHSFSPYFNAFGMSAVTSLGALYVYQEYGRTRLSFVFEAFGLFIGALEALCVYLNMRWNIRKIGESQFKFQEIVDRGESSIGHLKRL